MIRNHRGNLHASMARRSRLKNIVWKEGKYFVAQCLNVDVSSFGKTKAEALRNLNEALELYFEDLPMSRVMAKVERPQIVDLVFHHA